ncbi:hypothetical protein ACOMHN_022953 [Nucella lapillus]
MPDDCQDITDFGTLEERAKKRESNQRYWNRLKQDPQRYQRIRRQQKEYKLKQRSFYHMETHNLETDADKGETGGSRNPPASSEQCLPRCPQGTNNKATTAFINEPIIKCHVCYVTCDLLKNVCEHLSQSLHPFQCTACKQDFLTKYDLCRHGKHCLGLSSVPCPHCPMTFSQSSSLRDHVQAKHSGQEYCCLCGARFKWRPSFNRHRKSCKSWQAS